MELRLEQFITEIVIKFLIQKSHNLLLQKSMKMRLFVYQTIEKLQKNILTILSIQFLIFIQEKFFQNRFY